jgi:phytoene dehydrogenase-like protein
MSGLAAGIRMAQFDQRVLILEQHSLWGGLNSFYKQAGRRFDTGLHALTNFVPRGTPHVPLTRVLRQLRLDYDALKLREQSHSVVAFPGLRLRFSNDFELFRSEVHSAFPERSAAFDAFVAELAGYNDVQHPSGLSARAVLLERLGDARLVDALLLPTCYYGSPRPGDLDWNSFTILFRSIFLEGFSRPEGGVKHLLDLLVARYRAVGGELRMRTGVDEVLIERRNGTPKAVGLRLADGTEVRSDLIISSAGWAETLGLAGIDIPEADVGRLTFVEAIAVVDRDPSEFGHDTTITFFNDADSLVYDEPEADIDLRSGVICCPNSYAGHELTEGILRVTCLARYDRWTGLTPDAYSEQKARATDAMLGVAAHHAFDARPHAVHLDTFTPRTIHYYTRHRNGAIYGSPQKHTTGATPVAGLYLCGTDQGMLGIVGAMLSGIAIANAQGLPTSTT